MDHCAILSLGSNKGDCVRHLAAAIKRLDTLAGRVSQKSSVYLSASWGFQSNDFLNQVIVLQTPLEPFTLFFLLQSIEKQMGRNRFSRKTYTPREIDIDILYYDDVILDSEKLIIPHPLLEKRRFVLVPLAEILPLYRHPVSGFTQAELLDKCPDPLSVIPYQ